MIKIEESHMPMLLLGTTSRYMPKMIAISAAVNAWLRREHTQRHTHTHTHRLTKIWKKCGVKVFCATFSYGYMCEYPLKIRI